jgi:hypothetical protein
MPPRLIDPALVVHAAHYVSERCLDDEVTRINIQIPLDLLSTLDAIVETSSRSRSAVIEQLLFLGLENLPTYE